MCGFARVIKPDDNDWKKFIDSPIALPDEETTVKKVIAEEILDQISKGQVNIFK